MTSSVAALLLVLDQLAELLVADRTLDVAAAEERDRLGVGSEPGVDVPTVHSAREADERGRWRR